MPLPTIRDLTAYSYRQPVSFGEHRIMMRPRESYDQRPVAATLAASPSIIVPVLPPPAGSTGAGDSRFGGLRRS